ncbi:MAG: hypothetical protein ACRDI2_09750 [Chloroflexota bacterium]
MNSASPAVAVPTLEALYVLYGEAIEAKAQAFHRLHLAEGELTHLTFELAQEEAQIALEIQERGAKNEWERKAQLTLALGESELYLRLRTRQGEVQQLKRQAEGELSLARERCRRCAAMLEAIAGEPALRGAHAPDAETHRAGATASADGELEP